MQVDGAQKIDVVMHMYNFIKYSDAYLKTSESLWQHYRDQPALDNNGNIINIKQQITGETGNGGTKDVKIMVPTFWDAFNYLRNESPVEMA